MGVEIMPQNFAFVVFWSFYGLGNKATEPQKLVGSYANKPGHEPGHFDKDKTQKMI